MVDTTNAPSVGAIGLSKISGNVGKLIRLAQWANGDGWDAYQHAMICVQVDNTGRALVVQAEPGPHGANLQWYGPDDGVKWSQFPLSRLERRKIAKVARGYVGTRYSWLDYGALALHRFRIPVPYLRTYIQGTGSMICSQLCDRVYQDCGIHLFTDKRWDGYVVPAMLDQRLFGARPPA